MSEWIKCSDRLPRDIMSAVGSYLVYAKGQSPYVATFFAIPVDDSHWHNFGFAVHPTHWMPLPEPPKE